MILRAVNTMDAMTAMVQAADLRGTGPDCGADPSGGAGHEQVLSDLTPKPCGTIEWE